jgi:antirestriction protein ArdC
VGLDGNCGRNFALLNLGDNNMDNANTLEKKDIFQWVTDEIISAIEAGASSYKMPWKTGGGFPYSPINAVSKRPYRGINILILWATAQRRGYQSGLWATFKQWQEMGAQVRKGEKSAHVVFWKFFDKDQTTDGETEPSKAGRGPIAKDYWIFNADQVDGYQRFGRFSAAS